MQNVVSTLVNVRDALGTKYFYLGSNVSKEVEKEMKSGKFLRCSVVKGVDADIAYITSELRGIHFIPCPDCAPDEIRISKKEL